MKTTRLFIYAIFLVYLFGGHTEVFGIDRTASTGAQLQTQLAAANSGDVIKLLGGVTYYPSTSSDKTATFLVTKGVTLSGGWEAGFSTRGDIVANPTILSGDYNNNDVYHHTIPAITNASENANQVLTWNALGTQGKIDGIIISGGNGVTTGSNATGLNIVSGNLDIVNTTFTRNKRALYAGAGTTLNIDSCLFTENYNGSFGTIAILSGSGNTVITNSIFRNNSAAHSPIYLTNGAQLIVSHSTFNNNQITVQGGAIIDANGSSSLARIIFSTFANNMRIGAGDAKDISAVLAYYGRAEVYHSTFIGNAMQGEVLHARGSNSRITYGGNVFLGNTTNIATMNAFVNTSEGGNHTNSGYNVLNTSGGGFTGIGNGDVTNIASNVIGSYFLGGTYANSRYIAPLVEPTTGYTPVVMPRGSNETDLIVVPGATTKGWLSSIWGSSTDHLIDQRNVELLYPKDDEKYYAGAVNLADILVSGTVSGLDDNSGIKVYYRVDGGVQDSVLTAPNGAYVISVPSGSNLEIIPSNQPGYVSPPSIVIMGVATTTTGQDLIYSPSATFTVSGTVTGLPNNTGIVVGYRINGGLLQTDTITDSAGKYSITVPSGVNVEIVPSVQPTYTTPGSTIISTILADEVVDIHYVVATTFTVSGTVTGLPDNENIVVDYKVNGTPLSTTTDSNGEYSVTVPANSNVEIIPSVQLGYDTPADTIIVTIVTDETFDIHYLPATTFTISGTVTGLPDNDSIVVGYRINGGPLQTDTVTDSAGNYSITVPSGANVEIVPSDQSGYITPGSTMIPTISEDKTVDIAYSPTPTFTVSGEVTGLTNNVGVIVNYKINGTSGSTTTNSNGEYDIIVASGVNVEIIPIDQPGYITPADTTISNILSNKIFNIVYAPVPTFTISGTVTGLPDNDSIVVGYRINGGPLQTDTITDSDGKYSIKVPAGANVEIVPSDQSGYITPGSTMIPTISENKTVDIAYTPTSTFTVSGTVTGLPNNVGVTVNYTENGTPKSKTTDSNGEYSITVPANANVSIIPSPHPGYTATGDTTLLTITENKTVNIVYTPAVTFTVSGTVSGLDNNVGVTVNYKENGTPKSTITNSNGEYDIVVPSGVNVEIIPSARSGYTVTGDTMLLTILENKTVNIVYRKIPVFRWFYISSPYANATSASFDKPAGTIGTPSLTGGSLLGYYSEADKKYSSPFGLGVTFTPALGIVAELDINIPAFNPPTIATFIDGTIFNTGSFTPTVTNTGGGTKAGKNLLGNPYNERIDFDGLWALGTNSDVIEPSYWIRYYTGSVMAFESYNTTIGGGTGALTSIIPTVQAFWVCSKVASGTVLFTEAIKTGISPAPAYRSPAAKVSRIARFRISSADQSDEMLLALHPGASNSYDAYKTEKMANDADSRIPEIYTKLGNRELSINGMPPVNGEVTLPLGFRTRETGSFTISSTFENWDNTRIYLRDNTTGIETELTAGASYSFTSGVYDNTSRFSIIICAPLGVNTVEHNTKIFVNEKNRIIVETDIPNAECAVYNALGQQLMSGTITLSPQTLDCMLEAGVYLVKVGNKTERVIIK